MTFEELALEVQKDRLRAEREKLESVEYRTQVIYSMFNIWCRINDKQPVEKEVNVFLKEQYPDLEFHIKKRLFERFFGYEFSFDYNTNKWKSKKVKAV